MTLKQLKLEFFYLRKSIREYHAGVEYVVQRLKARNILATSGSRAIIPQQESYSVHMLSCHRDVVMLLWALRSWYRVTPASGQVYIHNDGTLTSSDKRALARLFPSIKVIDPSSVTALLENALRDFPLIRRFRLEESRFIFLKKLIDPYVVCTAKSCLVLDSDVMWFKKPNLLLEALTSERMQPYMMENNRPSYVYFKEGTTLDEKAAGYNAGIVSFEKRQLSLSRIESFLSNIDPLDKRNRFLEQAIFASCLEGVRTLPEPEYTISGSLTDEVVAKHYTSVRRPLFYIEALPRLA